MAAKNNDTVNTPEEMTVTETEAPKTAKTGGIWDGLVHFLREVQVELKKTNWPSRDELTKFTVVVAMTIVLVAAYLYTADALVAFVTAKLFK